jgi:hypothetical protein
VSVKSPACVGCRRLAPAECVGCGELRPRLHDHVYDEWWCRLCWDAFVTPSEESQDYDVYRVEGVAIAVTP